MFDRSLFLRFRACASKAWALLNNCQACLYIVCCEAELSQLAEMSPNFSSKQPNEVEVKPTFYVLASATDSLKLVILTSLQCFTVLHIELNDVCVLLMNLEVILWGCCTSSKLLWIWIVLSVCLVVLELAHSMGRNVKVHTWEMIDFRSLSCLDGISDFVLSWTRSTISRTLRRYFHDNKSVFQGVAMNLKVNWIDLWKIQDIWHYLSQIGKGYMARPWSDLQMICKCIQVCEVTPWMKLSLWVNVLWKHCLYVSQSTLDSECPLETRLRFGCLVVSVRVRVSRCLG
jgi:hypothetical protein